jgi:murein DD-endopeptidase MepM/ murein hydrolase activator NlpD
MTWRPRVVLTFIAAGTFAIAVTIFSWRHAAGTPDPVPAAEVPPLAEAAVPGALTVEDVPIQRGNTLDELLGRAGIDPPTRVEMAAALEGTFDVRKFRAGSKLTLTRSETGALESIEYRIDPDRKLQLSQAEGSYEAAVVEIPGTILPAPVCGTMQGSLFETLERMGEPALLALQVAEIFAWDLDFYVDPQEGDEFCLVVEKKEYTDGEPPAYRRILAAKYNNAGTLYDAYLFPDEDGTPRYFSHDGRSLQAAFLRSPLRFEARVSSRFSHRRFHPVLRTYRSHLGTDYAAPSGTPVQAIAAGAIVFSGLSGGSGNLVRIRHANGYESQYLHLSRRFVRAGQRVAQGERIGLVGATGLATGPHLDFRLLRNGKHVDFERLRPLRATSVSAEDMDAFTAGRDRLAGLMESGFRPGTTLIAEEGPVPASSLLP